MMYHTTPPTNSSHSLEQWVLSNGKYLGQIKAVLAELDGHKAMEELNSTGSLKLDSISDEVVLSKEDLLSR